MKITKFYLEKSLGQNKICLNLNEISLIIGKNGSGKTTILKALEALYHQDWEFFQKIQAYRCEMQIDSGDTFAYNGDTKEFAWFESENSLHNWSRMPFFLTIGTKSLQAETFLSLSQEIQNEALQKYFLTQSIYDSFLKEAELEERKKLYKKIKNIPQIWFHLKIFIDTCDNFLKKRIYGFTDIAFPSEKKTSDDLPCCPFMHLSEGEQRILYLFSQLYLKRNTKVLLVLDEPENHLHIQWQEQLIEAIRTIHQKVQILFATHSPEIVGHWSDYVISL